MLVLTTDEFAEWFRALDDPAAEEVAMALEMVEQLGPARALPGSSEYLLWYEHPNLSRSSHHHLRLIQRADDFGSLYDYATRVVQQLESARFAARLSRLPSREAALLLQAVAQIKWLAGPRVRWGFSAASRGLGPAVPPPASADEVKRWYFAALAAAGLEVVDVPAHSLALREVSLPLVRPGIRLLYGMDSRRETALFVLGERLDRNFYGDSVRRAEQVWEHFVQGNARASEPAPFR
jgi:hypothetical protein